MCLNLSHKMIVVITAVCTHIIKHTKTVHSQRQPLNFGTIKNGVKESILYSN